MYIIFSVLISTAFSISDCYSTLYGFSQAQIGLWAMYIAYIAMFFLGIVSIIFAYRRLSKPGISAGARDLVLKRHASGIIVFLLTNIYVVANITYPLFGKDEPPNVPDSYTWCIALKILYFSEGIISPLIRFNEPACWKAVVESFKSDIGFFKCWNTKADRLEAELHEEMDDERYLKRVSFMRRSQITGELNNSEIGS